MTLVFMFPGQSSRYPGMLDKLCGMLQANARLREQASDLLHWDLKAQYRADNPDAFGRNVDVQVGVFLANQMFLNLMNAHGVQADLSMGLSLGEWNHLVHAGALDLPEAIRAVRARGEAYDVGPRGWMASIQPIDLEDLQEVVEDLNREVGQLEIVNLNSPRQHVIAGDAKAVEAAVRVLEDEHYAQPVIIERQVPMHATSFAPVGDRFRETLEGLSFRPPRLPYVPNRLARVMTDPTREDFIDLLSTHVCSPVLWRDSIDEVVARHPDAVFVEVGPMAVLHNLLHRKWVRNRKFKTDSREDTPAHLAGVVAQIHELQGVTSVRAAGV